MSMIAGRFEMLAQAGSGGMGTVFRARDHQTGKQVAVKVLKLDGVFDLARFEREAEMLASVKSPYVVDYIAHGVADGVPYLAQEWVDGITLATHERTIGTSVRDAVVIAHGIARALGAIHRRDIIHRDIKPANIILANGELEQIKLVDFGIARQTDGNGVLTRTGMLVGTPSYMAPEMARGLIQLGPAADVWSLGCVLYEAMTGGPPFAGKTHHAIRAKLVLGEPPPIADRCPEASPELCALVHSMLAKVPELRPVDGWDVVERLLMLPEIADGPRRVCGKAKQPATVALGSAPQRVFVMFDAASVRNAGAAHDGRLAALGNRHGLDVHVFEDGSAVLANRDHVSGTAITVVRAAVELRREIADAAVSVCLADDNTVSDAIDRGSVMLERATLGGLFGGIVDGEEGAVVHLDDALAELLVDELPIETGPDGPIIRVP